MSILQLIERLLSIPSISGFEDEFSELVASLIEEKVDELEVDRIGNVIAKIEGEGYERVLVDAHMDEVGFIVKAIDENGFLRFTNLGGVDRRILPAQRVIIHSSKGKIKGVIGAVPPHFTSEEERRKVPDIEDLFIDIGASSREDVVEAGVQVSDPISFDRGLDALIGKRICGRGFDNKLGCAVAIETIFNIERSKLHADVYFSFTVEEERGLRGVRPVAFKVNPTIAIPLDTTGAADYPKVKPYISSVSLGKGPVIRAADRKFVADQSVKQFLMNVAEKNGIPYQIGVVMGTTNATAVQLAREGVATCPLCIPLRYAHSPVEVADLDDIENTVRLLVHALISIKSFNQLSKKF
ncbi:MAG: M42 family metallopeptidase [Candidatus Freyarchaeota archaeon]|nr:M42 family metallopeptidase [Candidatus Freyrarchaeum guaymaensis]